MKVTSHDLELFAARIRPHFERELRDIAYELALGIARCVGAQVKELRPETTFDTIFGWFEWFESFKDSLDHVEWVMMLEEELDMVLPDEITGQPDITTFRALVLHRANQRRAA